MRPREYGRGEYLGLIRASLFCSDRTLHRGKRYWRHSTCRSVPQFKNYFPAKSNTKWKAFTFMHHSPFSETGPGPGPRVCYLHFSFDTKRKREEKRRPIGTYSEGILWGKVAKHSIHEHVQFVGHKAFNCSFMYIPSSSPPLRPSTHFCPCH